MFKYMPKTWASGDKLTKKEQKIVGLLRQAGCKCELPLFGWKSTTIGDGFGYNPRCRLCNALSPIYTSIK